jgi:hypothetical protein
MNGKAPLPHEHECGCCRHSAQLIAYIARFPDVTAAELADTEQICIVCREELTQGKRLPCGHILHFHCLLNWLQRQQTCPICRTSVLDAPAPVVLARPSRVFQ